MPQAGDRCRANRYHEDSRQLQVPLVASNGRHWNLVAETGTTGQTLNRCLYAIFRGCYAN